MEVKIFEPISFCFGVKRAIELVNKIREEYHYNNIYLFGELIHNKSVMDDLALKGINVVEFSKNSAEVKLNSFKAGDIVIFSAHGHDKNYEEILIKNGVKYFDSTCPIVKVNLNRISKANGDVIFVGKEGHPETLASLSKGKNVYLYDINSKFDYSQIKSEKVYVMNQTTLSIFEQVYVMNQTTLSIFELKRIFKDIKEHFPNAIFTDEICNESRIRQENIASISDDYDLVIVIGDKNSSNTTKLFDIANKNKNRKNYLVSNLDEVKTIDLSRHKKVALFSGTSCPKYIIDEIYEYLRGI